MPKREIKTLLFVEHNACDVRLLRDILREEGAGNIELAHVASMREAERYLSSHSADVVLVDLGLPREQDLNPIRRTRMIAPRTPVVALSNSGDDAISLQALYEGAQEILVKGQLETGALRRTLRYAVERKTLEDALLAEKESAQVTLNSIAEGIVCADAAGNISFLNPAAQRMTGWSLAEAAGLPVSQVLRVVDAKSHKCAPRPMDLAVGANCVMHLPENCLLIRRDGLEIPIEDCISPLQNCEGAASGIVIVFRDVSGTRAMVQQIAHSAEHDFLTGLPNRMLLYDRLSQSIALAQRHLKKVAVLFLDLDEFKRINDSLGHLVGDKLLQSVAARLLDCVRASDTVTRQGGDEFVVLLSEVEQSQDPAITARRILQTVGASHLIGQHDLRITASIGVAVYPDDGADAEALVNNADTAMYHAKENGRNSFRFFKPAMNVRAVERQAIEESLQHALERNQCVLHYQPRVSLDTGEITGAEALLRWTHPVRGPIPPSEFIPVAEDTGLILPIGRWVVREACSQVRRWIDAGLPPVAVAVNVSALEFRDEAFLDGVLAALSDSHLDPQFLELELTESVLMKHAESSVSILRSLRAKGVRVAVDDFGTGYSSLSYLRKFPIDALKIDRSFIRQITTTPVETTIVTAVIGMGRSLNLRVVAEGVEADEELRFLQAHGCDEAQGHYFGRPMPAPDFARLLTSGIAERIPVLKSSV